MCDDDDDDSNDDINNNENSNEDHDYFNKVEIGSDDDLSTVMSSLLCNVDYY